jgi:hypothetical protein
MTCGKKPGMLFGRAPALYDILFLYSLPPLPELFLCMKEAGIFFAGSTKKEQGVPALKT